MEDTRQKVFQKLRPPCVELSSISLKFKGNLASSNDVLKSLRALYEVLSDVTVYSGLDEKLAEYIFFPLSQTFNESQRISAQCVELAVKCLQVLVDKGWRSKLSPQLGTQLLLLMTLVSGGTPTQRQNQGGSTLARPRSEELIIAAFDCVSSLCNALHGSKEQASVFNDVGSTTVIDQTVYVLLEGTVEGASDAIQRSAATALKALQSRITDRVVLASLLPRTVSSLTKTLHSTSQSRRSYKLFCVCLDVLTLNIRFVLNDLAASSTDITTQEATETGPPVLDKSWLNATVSQIKLALSNVIRLRNHERPEVRHRLLGLCLMVIEDCPETLADSLPMMVETIVTLAYNDSNEHENEATSALKHILTCFEAVVGVLKSSLHTWVVALPRVMQSNDDSAKHRAIRQISTAFQALSETHVTSSILDDSMTTSLHNSISAIIQSTPKTPQALGPSIDPGLAVLQTNSATQSIVFQPIIFERKSQKDTLSEIQTLIGKLGSIDMSFNMTRSMINRLHQSSGDSFVSSFWLALSFLRSTSSDVLMIDDILNLEIGYSTFSRPQLIEELYSISLPILTEFQGTDSEDWRTPALALEAVALQAMQLQESFRTELIDTLYPILQLMASNNPLLQNHAMTCLNIVTGSCNYTSASSLIIDNVDYLINSVALKLNTFDISPQAPKVLQMMIKLCGSRLIPHLDDIISSIFAVLDAFHGYPKLVELLFGVLGAIVDEGAKKPNHLAISTEAEIAADRRLKARPNVRSVSTIARWFKERRENRTRELKIEKSDSDTLEPHLKKAWGPDKKEKSGEFDEMDSDSQADQSEQPQEPEEKPLSKPHTLLLNIIKSIPPHLSSPSPFLRRSLLSILTRGLPILAPDENTFLPLINDLWPSVSARITLQSQTAKESTSLSTTLDREENHQADDTVIREQVFVTVASCSAISTMCKGAKDFMSSRVEQEYARWAKLYKMSWSQVQEDAKKAAERHQQQITQRNVETPDGSLSKVMVRVVDDSAPPIPKVTFTITKSFTHHHSIWKALTTLYITILSHVNLPADIGDDICYSLGQWITFLHPELYISKAWRANKGENIITDDLDEGDTDTETRWSQGTLREAKRALQAMDLWNPDLTWYICVLTSDIPRAGSQDLSTATVEKMNSELARLKRPPSLEDDRWKFATFVF